MVVVPEGGSVLAAHHQSLADGVGSAAPGAIFALALSGGVTVRPGPRRTIRFGRNSPVVSVCVGGDDVRVSRQHGIITHHRGQWWVSNTGQVPVRLSHSRWLYTHEEPFPLAGGYTPLFIPGSRGREHLLELYVAGADEERPRRLPDAVTHPPTRWRLTPGERLVLVVLGQRYLLHEANPQPLTRRQVAEQMAELQPQEKWDCKRVERLVAGVRSRLHHGGVKGMAREEVGEPVGNSLNDNLIRELVRSTSLIPPDLSLLDSPLGN